MRSLSLREYARHRKASGLDGGTHRAVQVAIESGRLVASVTRMKKIRSASEADDEWAASTKADHVPLEGPTAPHAAGPAPRAPNALGEARARREAAQASLREMELARRQGELVPARDVEAHLANVFSQCRARLMSIPARARQRDPSLSGSHLALFELLIREALEDLAAPEESDGRAAAG